jgi:hypothetical protein
VECTPRMLTRKAKIHRIAIADAVYKPRRAHARRSSLSVRRSPNDTRFSRYGVGIANHGGLTNGAPDRMCVCASQKAVFHGRTIAQQSRAGGVSPPWNGLRACARETRKFIALPLQTRFTNPRRAHARRSSPSVCRSPNDARFSRYSVGVTNHGGLTPAAPVRPFVGRGTILDFRGTALVSRTTAG